MILERWAERLLTSAAPSEIVDLHAKDALAALSTGLRTADGHAIAKLYGAHDRSAAAAAIARLSESDDIHLPSCITPGSVVVPVALARGCNPDTEEFNKAICAGYAAGLALGMAIGGAKALTSGVWPTLLAAPLMAAVTVSVARGDDPLRLAHAMALALAGVNGRPGRPTGAPSGRWFSFAQSVAHGVAAADAAAQGFRGDLTLLSPLWLAVQAGHDAVVMDAFESSPSISDVGFKPFPIARQAMNAVIAFRCILDQGIDPSHIDAVQILVPGTNTAVISREASDDDRLSRLSNMGFQLACAAFAPDALYDAERLVTPLLMEFVRRVTVAADANLDRHLPNLWPARVVVKTGQQTIEETLIDTDFDVGATDIAKHLQAKWRRLIPEMRSQDFPPKSDLNALWQRLAAHVTMQSRTP